ncbi:MAG: hypothetical protein ABJF11_10735, partial [Reichenbachiella sp.]|uniref:hypothetical protein n=1 Tax=Reichenbachiella sp. TaxID=2184521 RepID=UPI003262D688
CTDGLNESQANALLDALTKKAGESPHFFSWQSYSLKGLINKQTMTKATLLAFDKEITFSLRMVLLQAFSKSALSNEHLERFTQLIFDTSECYAIRSKALKILPEYTNQAHWELHIQELLQMEDNDSLRLASDYIQQVNFDINDDLTAKVLIEYAQSNDNSVLKLAPITEDIPLERVTNLLNILSKTLPNTELENTRYGQGKTEISELVCGLILRLIEQNKPSAAQIWHWLSSTTPNFESYSFSCSGELSKVLHNSTLKQEIQLLVYSTEKDNLIPYAINYCLHTAFPPLRFDEEDIIALLERSPAPTIDWKGFIELCRHDEDQGQSVRAAAQNFAQTSEDQIWLKTLATPQLTEWEIRQEKKKELDDHDRARKIAQDKEEFLQHIEELRNGVFNWIYDPARA